MNFLDILVIATMALCIIIGAWRGFVRTVLGFANFVLAVFLTNMLYPHVGRFLRGIDGFFSATSTSIRTVMGLDAAIYAESRAAEMEIINALPLPAVFRDALIENNNPIIYQALGATGLADFISGFLAGIVINIISMVIVFVVIFSGLMVLTRVLNILTKLPVINSLNKLLGAALGAVWGLLLTWLVLGVVIIYLAANTQTDIVYMLENSVLAGHMHNTNFAIHFIMRLFP
ncbi:MAG: CvpA family protein [Defluviitaleaceae bacterium]|nr:CvpA family protein [Defluviitaleaceae bacterium]